MKKEKTNHEKKPSTWKDELLEGLVELLFGAIILFGAFIISFLFPSDIRKDIPFELLLLISVLFLATVAGVSFLIIHIVKNKKKTKELRYIHKNFKRKYNLTLMTVTRKFSGEDILVLIGKNETGKFNLYKENDAFTFSVEYFSGPIEKRFEHYQPQNVDEAMEYIENFMQGYAISDKN